MQTVFHTYYQFQLQFMSTNNIIVFKFVRKMISYYRIPQKEKNNISNTQILTITQQNQLKDSIYNKSILNIKVLNMKNSNINDNTISIFWTISQPLQIISLNLAQNFSFITDSAVDHLCQCTKMRNLKELNLADNSITNLGLLKISKASNMSKLQQLILYGNSDISTDGIIYLAESQFVKKLRRIDLHDTSVCDKGLCYFLKSENSLNLQSIDLSMNSKKITDETLKAIAYSKYTTSIKNIKLEDCMISDQGITALCQSQNLQQLQNLILNNSMNKKNNNITDVSLQAIAFSKYVKKLKILQLRNTEITSKGLNTLSVSLGSENLQILRLSHCSGIRDEAKKYLECIMDYRSLTKVYLNSTMMNQEVKEDLSKKYPNVSVIF